MTDEERRAWIRTLAVLAVVAAARWAWSSQVGSESGPGVERDIAAAIDTVQTLRSEEERRSRPLAQGETIDPNRADEIELDRLPGVGPATAGAIIAARAEAPFSTPEDLLAVRGIGPATLAKIRPHVGIPPGAPRHVGGSGTDGAADRATSGAAGRVSDSAVPSPIPVDLNAADVTELESLPGIGPALAARILRSRAEAGRYTRVDDLLRVSGIGPVTLDRLRPLVTVR